MNVEDALTRASANHLLIVQAGLVFFNTFDLAEVEQWEDEGAETRPWYTEGEVFRQKRLGREVRQGYEVVLNKAIDPILLEDDEGEILDITREITINRARTYVA